MLEYVHLVGWLALMFSIAMFDESVCLFFSRLLYFCYGNSLLPWQVVNAFATESKESTT